MILLREGIQKIVHAGQIVSDRTSGIQFERGPNNKRTIYILYILNEGFDWCVNEGCGCFCDRQMT